MKGFRFREHGASLLVTALSSAFGVALLAITGDLDTLLRADDLTGSSPAIRVVLSILAFVFIAISTYVGAVVTANTFATIIAGRTRTIALMRLVGATARSQRGTVVREGFIVGIVGSLTGALVGIGLVAATIGVAVASGFIPALAYEFFSPVLLIPVVAVVLTTVAASWVGSRGVLRVSPIQATGAASETSFEELARRRGSNAAAIVFLAVGAGLLALGVLLGFTSPAGLLVAVLGGMTSFTGIAIGSSLVMPPALRLVGRMLGSSATSRLASENAVRYPQRSSRMTIGVVIAVTLVTMFAVAAASWQNVLAHLPRRDEDIQAQVDQLILVVVAIFSVLIGFSAVLAAIGLVNNLSLSVLQRTRELGLLRALGFSRRQLRTMIMSESAQLSIASILVGLALGTLYGWAGAQSLMGAVVYPQLVVPVVPLWLVAVVALVAVVLTIAASLAPARRAMRVSPVTALAVE